MAPRRLGMLGALLAASLATSAHGATYRVGPGCTWTSLPAAIEAAGRNAGTDTIRLTKNAIEVRQTISISGQSLYITGGFDSCNDATDPGVDERTVLSATNFGTRVFDITGPGEVHLSNLIVAGGYAGAGADGGGIYYSGGSTAEPGTLYLAEMTLVGNSARYGGAIYVGTSPGGSILQLEQGVGIFDNEVTEAGGGVALRGNAELRTGNERLFFHRNRARLGGGLAVLGGATAYVGTAAWLDAPAFLANRATVGGGAIYVEASSNQTSRARLYSTAPDRPMALVGNVAESFGGAIYAYARAADSTAEVCAMRVNASGGGIERNAGSSGQDGAYVYVFGRGAYYGYCAPAEFPAGAVTQCSNGTACDTVSGTSTTLAISGPALGGTLATDDGRLDLRGVRVSGNRARLVIYVSTYPSASPAARVDVSNSLIYDNEIVATEGKAAIAEVGIGSTLNVQYTTIAANRYTAATRRYVVKEERRLAGRPSALYTLSNSILAEPGVLPSDIGSWERTDQNGFVNVLTLSAASEFERYPTLVVGDPLFRGPGDFRLTPGSPAVDFAPAAGDFNYDLDGAPRGVDLTTVPNRYGPNDLGAFELQSDPSAIFANGFE